jgi:hypothetical protein
MTPDFKDLIELFKVIVWPTVVGVALFGFRRPLALFLEDLGKRATKFSAFEVSIELATVPSPPAPWEDPTIYESSSLTGGVVTNTTIKELFQRIHDEAAWPTWQYLIVDVENGRRWLISRLLLFTVVLQHMRGLRCVVFVETKDEFHRRLLGIAKPEGVRRAIANRYPWLDDSLVKAWMSQQIPVLAEPLPKQTAESIVNSFVQDVNIQTSQDPQSPEWQRLGSQSVWEHTKWLDAQRLNEDLREVFYDRDASKFLVSPDIPSGERSKAVLRREVPFVALVNDRGEFKDLVDRQLLLNKVAARL